MKTWKEEHGRVTSVPFRKLWKYVNRPNGPTNRPNRQTLASYTSNNSCKSWESSASVFWAVFVFRPSKNFRYHDSFAWKKKIYIYIYINMFRCVISVKVSFFSFEVHSQFVRYISYSDLPLGPNVLMSVGQYVGWLVVTLSCSYRNTCYILNEWPLHLSRIPLFLSQSDINKLSLLGKIFTLNFCIFRYFYNFFLLLFMLKTFADKISVISYFALVSYSSICQ